MNQTELKDKAIALLKSLIATPSISKEDIDGYFVINGNLLSFVYLKATDKKWSKILYENDLRNYGTNSSYDLITYFAKNINVATFSRNIS